MSAPQITEEARQRVIGKGRARAERTAHFSWHLLLVTAPPVILVPVVGWMVWRLSQEGLFAVGLIVVAPVLTALLVVAARCMITIALEGLKEKRQSLDLESTRARQQVVSVKTWLVRQSPAITALDRTQPRAGEQVSHQIGTPPVV